MSSGRRGRKDRPQDDVYYFGLVAPADTHAKYCGDGLHHRGLADAKVAQQRQSGQRGPGVPGPITIEALLHELGHAHGRAHAPCGRPDRPDPAFPIPRR